MSFLKRIVWEIWLPVALLVLWGVASLGSADLYWPPLTNILGDFGRLWIFDAFISDAIPSLIRLTLGFVVAFVGAFIVGLVLGSVPILEEAVRPYIEILRSMPGVAVLPVMMLLLGTGDTMKVATIALVTAWPILLNTIDGVRSVEPILNDVASGYRLSMIDRIRFITMPAAMPQVFAGARIALAVAVVAMVVTEMVGRPGGIGYFVLDAQRNFDITAMWTGIFMLGIIGYVVNKGFALLEARVLRWHRGYTLQQKAS